MWDMPYFMTNEKWYYYDYRSMLYRCFDTAPDEAQKSLREYYEALDHKDE